MIHQVGMDGSLIKEWGSKGQGPGEFEIPFVNLWTTGDTLWVIDRAGMSFHRFEADTGKLIETVRGRDQAFFRSTYGDIHLKRSSPMEVFGPTDVAIVRDGEDVEVVNLFGRDKESRAAFFQCGIVPIGDQVLIGTTTSIVGEVDLVIVDMKNALVLRKSTLALLDTRDSDAMDIVRKRAKGTPGMTIPVVTGWSASPELNAWMMTENTVITDFRVIRILRVNEEDEAMKIHYPNDESEWMSFQHLKGNRWLAGDGGDLIVFDLVQATKGV